ncbi:hypothetical protein HF086_018216 [Spodoptera exigua]|uniref:Uncharacterized protein n=1 Tax=Spodoptera exigua TaxID=7107 RepID=A0A922MMF1_SPOEX|nr:hypothetical protein HF086_018216 [Spodoptera exigua]
MFGVRLPPVSKISDVLSGQGPSFEAALARHLYSPISVYQTRLASPTIFEVPEPAASQVVYPQTYKGHKADGVYKQREPPPQVVDYPNVNLYSVKQPRVRFESYPLPVDPGFPRVHPNIPQEIYQPQSILKQPMSSIFPIYDQLGPIRYQGHVVPSQYLQQNRIYQFIPINTAYNNVDSENNEGKDFINQENSQESKSETTEKAQVQNKISASKQGYHEHPNGAISFASYSQNIPLNTQYEPLMQGPPNNIRPVQLSQIPAQHQPVAINQQQHKLIPMKQNFQYPQIFHKIIQEPQKYGQPEYPPIPQFIAYKQHIPNHADVVNELPQHLIFQNPRQITKNQIIQIPAFKPLPNSLLTQESYFSQTSSPSPKDAAPRPYNYEEQSTPQSANHIDQPLAPVLPQRQLTPLPPLKPNYSKFVKPLRPYASTTPIFLPTTLQTLPTTTESAQPFTDQLVSSTTVQPELNNQDETKEETVQLKTISESQTQQDSTAEHKEITQSLSPSVLPLVRSTTYTPSLQNQYSTPQPQPIPTQSPKTPLRHDVVIQKQEIQELLFDPSPQPSSTPQYPLQEHEEHQIRSQVPHQIFEQLQPPHFQQELHELHSQEYRHAPRQSGSPQHQYETQRVQPQQYVILQQAHPFQRQQIKYDQLHNYQPAEQSQPQQPHITEQTQSQPEQYQQHNLEPKNQIQVDSASPLEESKQSSSSTDNQQRLDSQTQEQVKPQLTTRKPEEQPEKASHSGISLQSYQGPVLSRIQALYAQPQQFVAQPEYGMVDVPVYPDVQYFGKFAQALFANLRH